MAEDQVKSVVRGTTQDMRYQLKKYRDEVGRLGRRYDSVNRKLRDQNRLLDKIRANSHASHRSRSASKKRDNEIVFKKQFSQFLDLLSDTFDLSFAMHEDAF